MDRVISSWSGVCVCVCGGGGGRARKRFLHFVCSSHPKLRKRRNNSLRREITTPRGMTLMNIIMQQIVAVLSRKFGRTPWICETESSEI